MPDVKALACECSPPGSPVTCSMDLEPCLSELPDPLSVYGPPLSDLERPAGRRPPGCDGGDGLLGSLGIGYRSSTRGHLPKQPIGVTGHGAELLSLGCVNSAGGRLYRSLENLHWSAGSEQGMYAYRSVESEFLLHCNSSGPNVYGVMHGADGMAFYPRRGLAQKDLPPFLQWLFPAVEDWDLNSNGRKGLRDKLRLQSTRVTEPHKPLRPLPLLSSVAHSFGDQEMVPLLRSPSSPGLPGGQREPHARRITSPEEIKQEVLRRLQLRRQRSSPNLSVGSGQEPHISRSYTSEAGNGPAQAAAERKRPPTGRLRIPTFEEFKRMRQRESSQAPSASPSGRSRDEGQHAEGNGEEQARGVGDGSETEARRGSGREEPAQDRAAAEAADGAICTGPAPRSLLHSQAPTTGQERVREADAPGAATAETPPFPPLSKKGGGGSSCCPAILLDGTDLSSYGAKIYKMKEGLLGSALDLIKKSCSAEISAEAPVRLSRDRDDGADITAPQPGGRPAPVAMTTPARRGEACTEATGREGEQSAERASGVGCRRSSSDAAYEPAESARAQRECRLRPHYSDPMPADAAKRKQLEMKIAAAARLHSQRREREGGACTSRGCSEPRGEGRSGSLGVTRAGRHRWSTLSSLSADSGVVGLGDDREDEDEPRRARRSAGSDVERVDSGIGPGLARGWKRPSAALKAWESHRPCPDCGHREGVRGEGMCERCSKLRTERKEAILEFLNTESSYGEDLRIIKEEFYCPMQSAGLLTTEQLAVVFGNVQELIDVNDRFTEHLQDSIDQAFDQGDEELQTVCIGEIFLEFVNMLPAFQTYCSQQSTSVNMLNALEKEKELLRIFLDVSQNDNTALRRMNLRSFLMAPLQRVTKYPLLLSRIIKATGERHPDHGSLREAKSRVESHLEHINMKTKQEGTAAWSLRSFRRSDSRRNREVVNIEMREVSVKTVGWARESTRFIMEGPLQLSQPADGQWVKKGSRALKFQNVQSLLMVRTQRAAEGLPAQADGGARGEPQEVTETVQDSVLVLIKDKSGGKFAVLREPIRLANCVVSADPECDDTFEVLDIRREAFVFRASEKSRTQQWFRQIKRYACDLGLWRKRRNALPNIMISTTQSRS
ncbi:hypothetical protein P4O66_014872 [Electrophorus voltai]|uniref:DH domain-containing protein n=1 Tax=Electrophorus voltai TaxID=2609070 RepID=A0AAD8YZ22_9TELE|nr:hypothetical protein P4O66_014872 [Electrophorus voltai]